MKSAWRIKVWLPSARAWFRRLCVARMTGDRVLTAHRRLFVQLARCARINALPLPTAIFPDPDGWTIRLRDRDTLTAWTVALGYRPLIQFRRFAMSESPGRWVVKGIVCGVPVQLWAPARVVDCNICLDDGEYDR